MPVCSARRDCWLRNPAVADCALHRQEPEFLFVPPDQVIRIAREAGATPHDMPVVEFRFRAGKPQDDARPLSADKEPTGQLLDQGTRFFLILGFWEMALGCAIVSPQDRRRSARVHVIGFWCRNHLPPIDALKARVNRLSCAPRVQ
jgi:hypothetical protein